MLKFLLSFIYYSIIIPLSSLFQPDCWSTSVQKILSHLRIQHQFTKKAHLIPHGYILANHRSFFDFAIDPYLSKSTVIGRYYAFFAVAIFSICGLIDKRIIPFNRSKTGSHTAFHLMQKHMRKSGKYTKRILFYPEGTRRHYNSLQSPEQFKENYLRYGLLKRVWEDGRLPVQLMLTSNKELVFNEKKWVVNRGVNVRTILGEPVYPRDFLRFEDFVDKIAEQWVTYYNEIH